MKKLSLALAAVLTTVPAIAHASEEAPLAGASVGIAITHDSTKVTLPGTTLEAKKSGLGVVGFVGYDAVVGGQFLLGAQAEIGTGGKTIGGLLSNTGPASFAIDPGLTYGASVRGGYLASEQLAVYGRVGIRMLRANLIAVDPSNVKSTERSTETGFTYGLGAEYALAPGFSVRGEFNRTNFDRGVSQNKFSLGAALRF